MAQTHFWLTDNPTSPGDRETNAGTFRKFLSTYFNGGQGVARDYRDGLAVSENAGTANMSVDVAAGGAWVGAGTEVAFFLSTAKVDVTLSAADGSNPRIDVIVADMDLTQTDGEDTLQIAVVEGTPGASPAIPSLTQTVTRYMLPLAHVLVGTGVTSISDSNITDQRHFVWHSNKELFTLPSDLTINGTTFQDISGWFWNAEADTWWAVEINIYSDNNSDKDLELQFDMDGSNTLEGLHLTVDPSGGGALTLEDVDESSMPTDDLPTSSTSGVVGLSRMYIFIHAVNKGTIQLQISERVTGTANDNVKAGSWMTVKEVS